MKANFLILILVLMAVVLQTVTSYSYRGSSYNKNRKIQGDDNDDEEKTTDDETQKKLNKFVDGILSSFCSLVIKNHLQPFAIPDIQKGFSEKILGPTWSANATLFNGSITHGLQTVNRTGDAKFTTIKRKHSILSKLWVEIEIKHLQIESNYSLKLMNFGPHGYLIAKTDAVRLSLEIQIKSSSHKANENNINIKIGKIDIIHLSPLEFSLDGNWPFDYFFSIVTTVISKILKKTLLKNVWMVVEQILAKVINEIMTKSPLPLFEVLLKVL